MLSFKRIKMRQVHNTYMLSRVLYISYKFNEYFILTTLSRTIYKKYTFFIILACNAINLYNFVLYKVDL